jgi:hypothetical protein
MGLAVWRDLSLILLLLEAMVFILPILAIGYFMVKGLRAAHAWLALQFPLWQSYVNQGRDLVAKYAALVASPVMAVAAVVASIVAVLKAVVPGRFEQARGTWYGEQ